MPDIAIGSASDMHQTADGHYWISTYGSGLFYWNGYDFTTYNIYNSNLASDYIKTIHEDLSGQLWFTHTYVNSVLNPDRFQNNGGIFGQVYFDSNQNEAYDVAEEARLPFQRVKENHSDQVAITSQNGTYAFYPESGDAYALSIETNEFQITTAEILEGQFERSSITGLDFGLWTAETEDALSLDITPGPAVCGRQMPIWVNLSLIHI